MKKSFLISLFLFILLPSLIFAQPQLHWLRIEDFSGGLNSDIQSWKIADNEATDLLNVYVDEIEQGISKRKGYAKANSTGTTSQNWLQSTTSDFNAGTLVNIDTTTVVDTYRLETSYWTQTSASDFAAGTLVNIDTTTISGTFRVAKTTEAKDQSQETQDTYRSSKQGDYAQSFKPSIDCICTKAQLYLKKVGTPGEDLEVYLKADDNNSPGDTLASTTIAEGDIGTSYAWEDANWTDTNLTAATRYWIYVPAAGASLDDQYYWGSNSAGGYADGNGYWDYGPGYHLDEDFCFKIYEQHYESSSNLISQIGDLGIKPSSWGNFVATQDLNGCTIDWYIQTSSSSDMSSPTGWIAVTNNTAPSVTLNRYVQWKSVLNPSGNATPVVYDVTINGKITGSLTSQYHDCTDVVQWGRLEANHTLNGQTITYAVRTSSYSAGLSTATWYAVESGDNITAPVNRYAQWISTLTSTGSQTPIVNNVTIYWYSTPVSVFDYPITSLHRLKKSDASEYMWAVSSGVIYGSNDAGTFTSVKSGMSTTYDVNWTNLGDSAYCVDGSTWSQKFTAYDSCTAVTTVPRGRFIIEEGYRLWVGYPVGYPNRLYYSDLADDTTWNWVYIPGEGEITGLGKLQGSVIVYKTNSTWKVIGVQVSTEEDVYFVPSLVNLSSEVGCVNHRTIQNFRLKEYTVQLFLGKDNVYATNGVAVVPIGDKIENTIEDLKQATFASSYSWLQTVQTDWEAGTYGATTLDTSGIELKLEAQDTDSEFNAGTKSSVTVSSNQIKLTKDLEAISNNSLETGSGSSPEFNFDNWTEYRYEREDGSSSEVNAYITRETYKYSGSYSCKLRTTANDDGAADAQVSQSFLYSGGDISIWYAVGEYYKDGLPTLGGSIQLRLNSQTGTLLASHSTEKAEVGWRNKTFTLSDSYIGNTIWLVAKSYATSRLLGIEGRHTLYVDLSSHLKYQPSGDFTSQSLDYGSIPNSFGNLAGDLDVPSNTTLKFKTASSTYSTGGFDTWLYVGSAGEDGGAINSTVRQYLKWTGYFTSTTGGKTSTINSVYVGGVPFISQYHDVGTGITYWGIFKVNSTLNNQTISYQVRSSTWSGAIDGTSWYDVVPGGLIPCLVNRYVQWKAIFNTTDGTQNPTLEDVSVYWWAGAFSGSSPASVVYDDRYHLFAMTSGSDVNDIDLVLNENGAWVKHDIEASSAIIYDRHFYTGSSTTTPQGSWIYKQDIGYSDDLQPINSYWQSKDYDLGIPYKDKTLRKIWTVCKRVGDYPLNLTYTMDMNRDSENYDIDLSQGQTSVIGDEKHIPSSARAKFFSFKVSNSGENQPWELYRIDCGFQPSPGGSEP